MTGENAPPKAVILVGGPGTRLQPLTYSTPKSMVPVLNKSFLEHTIAYLRQFGIKEIILTLSYLPEVIQDYFTDGSRFGVKLYYCLEKEPRGTAGAVKNAEKYLDGTFIVLNGDIFTDLDIADMLACHWNNKSAVTISLKWVDNPSAFGVVETDNNQRVKRFVEKPPLDEATTNWINAGIYILEPEVLKHIPADNHYMFEKGLFPHLLDIGEPVYGYHLSGYWLDMGNLEKYLSLNSDLLSSKTSSPLLPCSEEGIYCDHNVAIHSSAMIEAPVLIGRGCQIGQDVHIKGPVVIGPDCHIAQGASIENSLLWHSVYIGARARLSHCIIGDNTRIESEKQVLNSVVIPNQITSLSH